MRGAPRLGFSAIMRKISSRPSGVCLRPIWLSHFGNERPIKLIASAVPPDYRFHPDQRPVRQNPKTLSNTVSLGLGCLRFSAASCCRRAKFSGSRARRAWNTRSIVPTRDSSHQFAAKTAKLPYSLSEARYAVISRISLSLRFSTTGCINWAPGPLRVNRLNP